MFFIDQLNREIEIKSVPKRIISLVPSQTEYLYALGLEKEIVGITKFCIYPTLFFKSTTKIGGTKNFAMDKIAKLAPDLIIANKEENYQEGIEELQKYYPVWISDITTLEDSYFMMAEIGKITNKTQESSQIIGNIRLEFSKLQAKVTQQNSKKKVLYLIWQNPLMAAGRATFIDEMLQIAGFENVVTENRYPEILPATIQTMAIDYIFLSSEPYPFQEKHKIALQKLFPHTKIILVDGELFSWYGSRLQYSAGYFQNLLQKIEN
jgi:ABC-type Fe3+-hydroxamate transport system substrate-binding protein